MLNESINILKRIQIDGKNGNDIFKGRSSKVILTIDRDYDSLMFFSKKLLLLLIILKKFNIYRKRGSSLELRNICKIDVTNLVVNKDLE